MKTAVFPRGRMTAALRWLAIGAAAPWLLACANHTAPASISIAEALAAPDDSKVVITAQLVQQIDSEHYLFHDRSGQVTVVIDDDLLGKVKLAPEASLRIYGIIEQDHRPPQIEAKSVQVAP